MTRALPTRGSPAFDRNVTAWIPAFSTVKRAPPQTLKNARAKFWLLATAGKNLSANVPSWAVWADGTVTVTLSPSQVFASSYGYTAQ